MAGNAPTAEIEALRRRGVIVIRHRVAVLAVLTGAPRPLTAQQVHDELRRAGYRIGITNVYRALNTLAESGLAHTFDHHCQARYRRCPTTRHDHLVCLRCGLVQDRPATNTEERRDTSWPSTTTTTSGVSA
jgi:Fe2+ or Zn2+ uptake regulation protein